MRTKKQSETRSESRDSGKGKAKRSRPFRSDASDRSRQLAEVAKNNQ